MSNVFNQLKVVEIASVLAGPSVGLFFAEMGAKVTKVENKLTGGDVTRSWKLPSENQSSTISAYFAAVNWNKESIFLDFRAAEDLEKLTSLIEDADVLIANFKFGDAAKFGLSYSQLKTKNPNLIYGEINGFGSESDRVAYDLILQAETGFMSMNGTPESGPVKMPVALIDILAGHQLKTGILTALYERDLSNKGGAHVSVSLYDAAIASLANQATNWLMANHIPKRIGSTHPNIAPYGDLFTTKDKVIITFAIGSDKQFVKLCKVLKADAILNNSDFSNNQNRIKHRGELAEQLQQLVAKFDFAALNIALQKEHVPVAEIKDLKAVFETTEAQQLILEERVGNTNTRRVKTSVFKIKR